MYVQPVETRFGKRAPSVSLIVSALGMRGETIVPHGSAVANALGLTTQVPVRHVYLTSGSSGSLRVGAQTIELKHAPFKQLSAAGKPGEAIRAMTYLGPGQARRVLEKLPEADRQTVMTLRPMLSTKLAEEVSAFATND
jgi:hypothetical protein